MYHKKLNNEAVSPVIATILMVAITVVLAAVLYVMVIGFGGSGAQTPAGVITKVEINGRTSEKIYLGAFNPDTKWDQCKLILENTSAGGSGSNTYSMSHAAGVVTCTLVGTAGIVGTNPASSVTIAGTDLAQDNKISNGDSVTISGLSGLSNGAMSYKLSILYTPTGSVVCEKSFNF